MSCRVVPVVMLVTGCGRFGFGTLAPDGEPDTGVDVSMEAPLPQGPFGAAVPLGIDLVGIEDDPSLTGDQLEIFFVLATSQLWYADRASIADAWRTPVRVAELDATGGERSPEVSWDGLTMYFVSDRPGTLGSSDVFVTTRATRQSTWSAPVHLPQLSTPYEDHSPAASYDGLELFVHSRDAGGLADIRRSVRASTADAWPTPSPVAGLDTAADNERNPFPSSDGGALLFTSDRSAGAGSDLWITTRTDRGAPFDIPMALANVNTASDEEDPWLSPDGHTLVFGRAGGLMIATR